MKHPGEILREKYLVPYGMQPVIVAEIVGLPLQVLNDLVEEKQPITEEIAEKLGVYYADKLYWLKSQTSYERGLLMEAKQEMIRIYNMTDHSPVECERMNKIIEKINFITGT